MKKIFKLFSAIALLTSFGNSLNAQNENYCIPTITSSWDDDISIVMFAGISNTTICHQAGTGPGSNANYKNYTGSLGVPNLAGSVPAAIAIQGNSYSITVGLTMCNSFAYTGSFLVFIDYNADGDFFDTGELVWTSPPTVGLVAPASAIIVSPAILIPLGATPGLTRMRVWQSETSFPGTNPCGSITWGEVEDYCVNIIPPVPCTGTPPANTIVSTTNAICPNTSTLLSLANSYTLGNIAYQWQFSTTSALGPYTNVAVSSATNPMLSSPNLTVNTFFQLVVNCIGFGSNYTLTPVTISVQPITLNDIPYYESFEGIVVPNGLPNCSWVVPNFISTNTYIAPQIQNRSARTGNNYAAFSYTPAGTNYMYTNGLNLKAGVTYSASMWFTTDFYGYNTWNLSMLVGPNQSPTGLVSIANLPVAASPIYTLFSNTFTVPTTGVYYVAIRAISNGVCCGWYLTWDDLSITIPCNLNTPANANTPTITINGNANAICAGQPLNLTATGANTFTWNTGATTPAIADAPLNNTAYTVVGTNTLTNCTATLTRNIVVNPAPSVVVFASSPAICEGSTANITASGSATSFTWNTGATTSAINVAPTQNTTYTVIGSNPSTNCSSSATQLIMVNPLPSVSALNSPALSCTGAPVNLSASGTGAQYLWTVNSAFLQGNPVTVFPVVTTNYTVTATDENGCSNTAFVTQNVQTCLGISANASSISGLNVYPNPNNGEFTVELNNGLNKTVELMDVTGRVLSLQTSGNGKMIINIDNFSNGVYYIKVKSGNAVEVLKIAKQ